jgi:putative membrane protein
MCAAPFFEEDMMIKKLAASALVAVGLASAMAMAQAESPEPGTQPKQPIIQAAPTPATPPGRIAEPKLESPAPAVSAAEKRFMEEAARANMEEMDLGKLAKDHAQNEDVKKFGQRMMEDHAKVNDELKTLAEKKGITLPKELARAEQSNEERLSKLTGPQFDKQYVSQMLMDHRKDIAEFQRQAASAKDPDVKQFAQKTLPALQEHERVVANLARETVKEGAAAPIAPTPQGQPAMTPPVNAAPKTTPPSNTPTPADPNAPPSGVRGGEHPAP